MLDVEARQVASSVSDIDTVTKKGATAAEIDSLLGGMVRYLMFKEIMMLHTISSTSTLTDTVLEMVKTEAY